jgi:hypothetical protein
MSDDVQQGRKKLLQRGYVFPSAERRVAASPIAKTAVNTGQNEAPGLPWSLIYLCKELENISFIVSAVEFDARVRQSSLSARGDEKFTNFFQPPVHPRYTIAPLTAAGQGKPLSANLLP